MNSYPLPAKEVLIRNKKVKWCEFEFHFFSCLFLKMMTNLRISPRKLVLKSDDWLLGYFKAVKVL